MGSVRFEVVAKICPDNVNAVEFYLCAAGGYNRQVGLIEFPHDRQLGDNMASSDEIVKIIKKRIRKSV